MVIILNNKQNRSHPRKTQSLEQAQEKKSQQQNDQTYIIAQEDQKDILDVVGNNNRKDILVEADNGDFLPILGNKIVKFYEQKNLSRQQDGYIHIYEITNCLRQSLIYQQYPEEIRKLTIWDCMNFDHGLNSETVLVDILKSQSEDHSLSTEYQKDIDFAGISGHPDFIHGDWVFELKSVNKFKPLILSADSVKGYIRQVVYYMILLNIEKGRVIVKYNLPFFPEKVTEIAEDENFPDIKTPLYKLNFHQDTGQFPYYSIKVNIPLSAPIRQKVKNGLLEIVKPLYKQGDITKIPRLDGMLNGSNWKCSRYCKVREKCLQISDEQNDIEVRNIILNKHIDDQMDKRRVYGKRQDKHIDIS